MQTSKTFLIYWVATAPQRGPAAGKAIRTVNHQRNQAAQENIFAQNVDAAAEPLRPSTSFAAIVWKK